MTSSVYGDMNKEETIHGAFERVALEFPHREAIVSTGERLTYSELCAESLRIASVLIARGVLPGDIVPVVARRSRDLPAALLGILMAGAAYGILDVRWPSARIDTFVRDMRAPVVLADAAGATILDAVGIDHIDLAALRGGSRDAPAPAEALPDVDPGATATVFWTSGSTGNPKAVLSPHRATTRLFGSPGFMDWGDTPVMINAAAVAWDAFTLELWGMLLSGGTVLVHEDDLLLPPAIRSYVADFGATHLFLTPSLYDVIAGGDIGCLAGLRALLLGGDKPSPARCHALLSAYPGIELYNGYGPVESCVFATVHRIVDADTVTTTGIPAGRPVPGTELHILRDGVPVARGETGEVTIGGTGLAAGYMNAPDQTAAAFRDVTIDGRSRRVYLTGDQGRLDASGVLHFAGRKDAQIKVAGHRIEPAEIEVAALALGCKRAVAIAPRDRDGDRRIVLFAERPDTVGSEAEMRGRLRATLPSYMVPAAVHFVTAMPLLENTKIDKRQLSARFGYPA
ncbi:AMP-binding protein [Streptomyces sp.]|uniref:AMP-binding protein n=1 Tax=Streptomyces sp. TaxID=1931 RepID=UPI0028122E63|nr:AMP-binding protein [Streptomyces sp.]